jgi:hypothetical protein
LAFERHIPPKNYLNRRVVNFCPEFSYLEKTEAGLEFVKAAFEGAGTSTTKDLRKKTQPPSVKSQGDNGKRGLTGAKPHFVVFRGFGGVLDNSGLYLLRSLLSHTLD